jgi:hypothetical protein
MLRRQRKVDAAQIFRRWYGRVQQCGRCPRANLQRD